METGRCAHAVSVLDRKLYVFGGTIDQKKALTSVECYDPIMKTWTATTPLPTPRTAHGKRDKKII